LDYVRNDAEGVIREDLSKRVLGLHLLREGMSDLLMFSTARRKYKKNVEYRDNKRKNVEKNS